MALRVKWQPRGGGGLHRGCWGGGRPLVGLRCVAGPLTPLPTSLQVSRLLLAVLGPLSNVDFCLFTFSGLFYVLL